MRPTGFLLHPVQALAVALLAASAVITPAMAQTAPSSWQDRGQAGSTRNLTLGVGKSMILDLPRDAAEIFVGNPKVANAVVRSARKIYVVAVENGQTSIYALDRDGNRIATIEISVGRDTAELRQILKTAIPSIEVDVKTVGDTIILAGFVDSAVDAQRAQDIASAFVGYTVVGAGSGGSGVSFNQAQVVNGRLINSLVIRGRDQVMVKVTVAEVQRQAMKQLGVNPSGSFGTGKSFFTDNATALQSNQPSIGSGAWSWATNFGTLGATIKAFERHGVARVLAEPTVTAISGESAKFTAGGEIPVPTTETCSGGSSGAAAASCTISRSYKPYGVSLNFTPVVLSEGRIQLHVQTEVTEVDGMNGGNGNFVNFPAFRTRKNETTVELPSGGSIVSAGLIQQKSRQIINGQPALMNLPILGTLFRSRDFQNEETELMIIVTPYISKPVRNDQLARPDDGFAAASDPQSIFLGRVNRIYSTSRNPEIIQSFKGRVGFITD